ncbi:hypothetical protein LINPERHAP2_LOCUS45133, partial [Linum perenne]
HPNGFRVLSAARKIKSVTARGDPLSPREQLEQSSDSRRVQDWDPRAQPSEPILFPRLR